MSETYCWMLQEDVAFIFKLADVDNSGTLTAKEFRDAIELLRSRYPQIDIYLQRQHMKDVLRIIDNNTGSDDKSEVLLDIEEFKKSLVKVDSQMKALPATAQVFWSIISNLFFVVFFLPNMEKTRMICIKVMNNKSSISPRMLFSPEKHNMFLK